MIIIFQKTLCNLMNNNKKKKKFYFRYDYKSIEEIDKYPNNIKNILVDFAGHIIV